MSDLKQKSKKGRNSKRGRRIAQIVITIIIVFTMVIAGLAAFLQSNAFSSPAPPTENTGS